MTKNLTLKNLLRTTAIVGTLFMGNTWGASQIYLIQDGTTDVDVAAGSFNPAAGQTIVAHTALTGANASTALATVLADHSTLMLINADAAGATTYTLTHSGTISLGNACRLYLLSGNTITLSGVPSLGSSTNTGINYYLSGPGGITLPDMSASPLSVVTLNILGDLTLTGGAAGFAGTIDIGSGATLTQATWTRVGGLSGAGTLGTTTAALTVTGDVTGTLTMTQGAYPFSVLGNMTTTSTTTLGAGETWTVSGNASLGAVALNGLLNIGGNYAVGGTATFGTAGILKVAGALSGTGQLDMTSSLLPFTYTGTTSGFTGAVVLPTAANVTFANAPKSVFTNLRANSLTFTNGGTVTSITTAATGGTIAGGTGGDLTITTLTQGDSHDLTLNPGTGKKMTVTTLSQHASADENLTVGSGGTMVFSNNINIGGSATHTYNSATTMKKFTLLLAATPTAINFNESSTIEELDVTNAVVTLTVPTGKTLTVKKVTGNNNITLAGSGTLSIKLPSNYTGDITTTGGNLKTN